MKNSNNFQFRGESHIDFCVQCVIMMQTRWPQAPCYMFHSQNFNKNNSFLEPVLNIIVLRNVIRGWGRGLLKRGWYFASNIDLEVFKVGESSIHQSKSLYYLGLFQTFKVELSAKSIFSYKMWTYFAKGSNVDLSLLL